MCRDRPASTSRLPVITLLVAAALLMQGCSAIQLGGGSDRDLEGTWDGRLVVQGQSIPGTLAIIQNGRNLEASFVASSLDLQTEGAGEVADDGEFWVEMAYDLECPGTARLEGRSGEGDQRLTGTVEAQDCTGTVTGSFTFDREGEGGGRRTR